MQKTFSKKYKLDIIFPVLMVGIFAFLLIFERASFLFSNDEKKVETIDSLTLIDDEYSDLFNNINYDYNENALIIYDEDNVDSVNVKDNISFVLKSVSVNVTETNIDSQKKYSDLSKYDTIVICIHHVGDLYYKYKDIESWVSNGGGLVFAIDLLNVPELDVYKDLLGIDKEEEIYDISADSMIFLDDYLMNIKNRVFDDSVISSSALGLAVDDNVNVHAVTNDDDRVPLLWDLEYDKGYVSVCNSNLLTGKQSRGTFMAMYSSVHDFYAYPVINSAMYHIDDFPSPIPSGYNDIIFKEYGYTTMDFYSNVWWPSIKNISLNSGVKFTGYVIQTYENDVDGPFNNTFFYEISKHFAQSLISVGGELGIHGYNHQPYAFEGFNYHDDELEYVSWKSENAIINSFGSVLSYAKSLTKNAKITSYVAPSNIISPEGKKILQDNFKEIRVYAGVYIGNEATMLQEYQAYADGTVDVPRIISGMTIDNFQVFSYLNEMNYHFVMSNFMHPDDVLDPERSFGKSYKELLNDYQQIIDEVNTTGIRNTTASEGAAATQRYTLTSVNRSYEDKKLILDVNGIYDEVYYMLKTNGKNIANVSGATCRKIQGDYYLLLIKEDKVVIEME